MVNYARFRKYWAQRKSLRAPWWDYGWNGYYFVTIVIKNRQCLFGEIIDSKMILSGLGQIARNCWLEIPEHFPFVKLGEFVIMPDHVHGVVEIDKAEERMEFEGLYNSMGALDLAPPWNLLKTLNKGPMNKFGPQSRNLGSIVRGFKIGVTKFARQNQIDFEWQRNYHAVVILNTRSLRRISNYIKRNPMAWEKKRSKTEGL